MKEESYNPWTDPELEARIVALLLGEVSDFEREELNRLIDQRPELAAFKEQIQGVHRLLRDVAAGESVAEDDDWKLAAEKRNAVLAAISGETQEPPANHVVTRAAEKRISVRGNLFWNLTKIAVAICVVALVGSIAIPEFFRGGSTGSSPMRMLVSSESRAPDALDGWKSSLDEASPPAIRTSTMGVEEAVTTDEMYWRGKQPAAVADFDHEENSKSALSAIRGTLDSDGILPSPYYLLDDVQYFSAEPEFELSRGAEVPRDMRAGEEPNGAAAGRFHFGAGVSSQAGVTGTITVDEKDFALDLDGDGDRPTDSQPTAPKSGGGDLSFPMLAASSGDRQFSEPAAPAGPTVTVTDGGTVLLGGIKRTEAGQSVQGAPGESTVSSPMALYEYGESKSGGGTQGVAGEPAAALGLGDKPVTGSGEVSSPDLAVEALGSQGSGQKQDSTRGQRRLRGDTQFSIPGGLEESLAAGENGDVEGGVMGGQGPGGGGFGINGRVLTDEYENAAWGEHKPDAVAEGESNTWRKADELAETEPAVPIGAGMGGMGGGMGGEARENGLQDKSLYQSFGLTHPEMGKPATAIPSLTTKLMSSKEDPSSKEDLAISERHKEEVAKGEVNMPSDDDLAAYDESGPVRNPSYSIPIPEPGIALRPSIHPDHRHLAIDVPVPMTGTAIGKPLSVLDGRRAEHGKHLLADDYNENGTRSSYGRQSGLTDGRDEMLGRRDQLATSGQNHWYRYVPPMLVDNSESMNTWEWKSPVPAGLNEKSAEEEAFSTFSLHVSDVSFKLARAALASGQWPEAAKIRIEEFVNAFDYGDPMPTQSEKVSCRLEQSIHPFLQQRNLLRISMRTAAAGRASNTPLRLTLLLDNSGSMERVDRRQTVRRAFALLVQQLKPIDQVTLISFARQPRLLADKVGGAQLNQLLQLVADLPSEGGTNIEAALQLAFEKAQEQQVVGAQNRIILLTDGAVNLGDANPESLSRMIATMRAAGIAFDAAGISAEGLNDEILEALTRKGDGRYYLLDSLEAADDGFARQIAGALRPSARNVKVQVEFNPKRVGRYKLLGFEEHRLNQEDFRNDKVDAAEMAAAEAGVAVYQFEAKPDGEGDVGSVSVRFQDLSTGEMIENRWPIPYEAAAPRPEQAAPSLRIATSAAMLAARLRGEPLGETIDLKMLSDLIAGLPERDRNADRVQQLQRMIQQARQVDGG